MISQLAGDEALAELDWARYRDRYGNIGRLDLILEAEGDSTNRYQAATTRGDGLIATGDAFGTTADTLASSRVVAVPDLLGFGHSLDEKRYDFGTSEHLAAIDAVVAGALGDRPLLIVAHSMGSTLALRWAALHPDRVEQVICVGPPIWPSRAAARRAIGNASPMSRIFVLDERIARRACALSCRHRALAGWTALRELGPSAPTPRRRSRSSRAPSVGGGGPEPQDDLLVRFEDDPRRVAGEGGPVHGHLEGLAVAVHEAA